MPVEVRVTTAALLVNNWNCAAPARTRRIPTESVDRVSPSNTVAPVAVGTALIWARSASVTTPSGAAGTPQAAAERSDTADTSAKNRRKGAFVPKGGYSLGLFTRAINAYLIAFHRIIDMPCKAEPWCY
jgi:hypothetical protein